MPLPTNPGGGPTGPRPNPATPGEGSPNYGKQIDRWKSALKGDVSKKRQKKLRNKIQNARVDRWSDQVRARANAPVAHDSIYNSDVAAANQTYGNEMIGAAMRESAANRNYGFDPIYQQGGAQYNPYSRASELTAAWQRDQRTTLNSYAAAGQLYSGARERAVQHDNRAYLSDYNAARSDLTNEIAGIGSDRVAAEEARQAAILKAEEENKNRALEARPEDAPPPPKFIKKEKRQLKNRIEKLKEQRSEAENKAKRRKITKRIKKAKENLNSIPQQYSEGKP